MTVVGRQEGKWVKERKQDRVMDYDCQRGQKIVAVKTSARIN